MWTFLRLFLVIASTTLAFSVVSAEATPATANSAFAVEGRTAVPGRIVAINECFNAALKLSSAIAISRNQVNQNEEQIKQARAGYFPSLSLQASLTRQEQSTNALAQNLSSTEQSSSSLNLSQNIFSGFKDQATSDQRKSMKQGNEWATKQAVLQLYKEVAQAFYSILVFQSDIAQYREQIESTKQRKKELSAAKRSGRARDSDILISESSISSLEAAVARAEGSLVSYRESLRYLTGISTEIISLESPSLRIELGELSSWLDRKNQHPDVQLSESAVEAAREGVKIAKSGFYPSLGFNANYYLTRPAGIFQGVDWDASLSLSFPLFSGGITKAQVSEAAIIQNSKELLLRQSQELADQAIRVAYGTVQSDLVQLDKLRDAAELSHRSFLTVHRDNQTGNAANTDVLTALQNWQESKRNLERLRLTTAYDFVRLRVESAHFSFDGLELTGELR